MKRIRLSESQLRTVVRKIVSEQTGMGDSTAPDPEPDTEYEPSLYTTPEGDTLSEDDLVDLVWDDLSERERRHTALKHSEKFPEIHRICKNSGS